MNHEFNLSKSSRSVINFALLFFWIALPVMIYILLESILALMTGQAIMNRAVMGFIVAALGLFFVMTFPLQIINQFNRIRVAKEGLYIEVYVLRYIWKFVKWADISDVRLLTSLDRWGNPQWLIKVKELTYWHRWISWQHKCGSGPGILINSDLVEAEKLLKLIEKRPT